MAARGGGRVSEQIPRVSDVGRRDSTSGRAGSRKRRAWLAASVCALAVWATGCNPTSQYGPLQSQWTGRTGAFIAAKPATSAGVVYVGSWDGYEYAYDEASGALRWRTNLGQTTGLCPETVTAGVTSSPWLEGGAAYLGGGDSNWYALDVASGAVRWSIGLGDNSTTGGLYNWSSPIVYGGHAYVGTSSLCDGPLVQGKVLRVNVTTHQVDTVWKVVADNQVGGTIWTSPVVDPASNTVFVTTGTRPAPSERYAEAIVALDATTLAVKSYWALPLDDPTPDADWGTSPTLFTDSGGRQLVAAINKNGILYAFSRGDLGAGPVWQVRIAEGGGCPNCGDGSASNGAFDGQRLYFAGGRTTIAGKAYKGSVRAIDPATGAIVWELGLPAEVLGALSIANGMLVVPDRLALWVVDPTSGVTLYGNDLGSEIFAAATVADGHLFLGTGDGVVHALAYPASAGAGAARAQAPGASAALAADAAGATPQSAGSTFAAPVALAAGPGCTVAGAAPSAAGAIVIDRLAVAPAGQARGTSATVEAYANGSCAGPAIASVALAGGHSTVRVSRGLAVQPGTVVSIAATRAVRLRVRLSGRVADTAASAATGPPPARRTAPPTSLP